MLKSKDVENVEQFQLNLILKTHFVVAVLFQEMYLN